MKRFIVTGIVFIFLSGMVSLYAQEDERPSREGRGLGPGHHMHSGGMGFWFGDTKFMKDELGMSGKQVEHIAKINASYRDKMVTLREKMTPKRRELRGLLIKQKVDLVAVKKVLNEIARIEVELRFLGIQHRLELEKQLTFEQKKRLRDERREMRRNRRHGGMMND